MTTNRVGRCGHHDGFHTNCGYESWQPYQPAQSGMGARERAENAAREIFETYVEDDGDISEERLIVAMADIIERAWAGEGGANRELHEAWQNWLEQHGVPLSTEFVRLANAIGQFTKSARASRPAGEE